MLIHVEYDELFQIVFIFYTPSHPAQYSTAVVVLVYSCFETATAAATASNDDDDDVTDAYS